MICETVLRLERNVQHAHNDDANLPIFSVYDFKHIHYLQFNVTLACYNIN